MRHTTARWYTLSVPDQPSWIVRVPEILAQLEAPDCPTLLDRGAIERLFDLSPRQANRLLCRCRPVYQTGRSHLVERESLASFVKNWREAAGPESRRRQRLGETLADARAQRYPRLQIPLSPREAASASLSSLPPGVELRPGQLRIDFATPVELIEKLVLLSQAIQNDFDQWAEASNTVQE